VLFGVAALLLKAGAVKWDVSLLRILNDAPPAAAAVLTPHAGGCTRPGTIAAARRDVVCEASQCLARQDFRVVMVGQSPLAAACGVAT